jgi:deoxyribonuclease-4
MLRFGTSGVPLSSAKRSSEAGIARARQLGLDHLELAWGNGVKMKDATADRIAAAAREHGISLTAHAPYYVNLCGSPEVLERSLGRLVESGRLGTRCGAESVTFHAGFLGARTPAGARRCVTRGLRQVTRTLRQSGAVLDLRPELTGRPSQVGALEDLLEWSAAVPGVRPCIDFSHHVARHSGGHNGYAHFAAMLEAVRTRLGRDALRRLHVHVSGIEWGPHGERRHVALRDTRFRWRELLRALKDFGVEGWLVCESPAMEEDALRLQRAWRRMKAA